MASSASVLKFRGRQQNPETSEEMEHRAYENEIVRQLDTLQETVDNEREKVLGRNWSEDVDRLYNLMDAFGPTPSFRPRILVPEMQQDTLHEASDLSDLNPIPYIIKKSKSKREEEREKAFIANWKQCEYNLEVLKACIWSLYCGTSYLEVALDPYAEMGQGEIAVIARNPATVFRDPFKMRDKDARWVIYEDWEYIDDVRQRFPENGWRIRHHRPGAPQSVSNRKLSMPDGPMSETGGPIGETTSRPFATSDSRVRVRRAYINDYSVKRVSADAPTLGFKNPKREMAYPGGRLIIECEGVVLLDRPNPIPLGIKPIVSVYGTPPLTSHFAPPAIKYTRDLQDLAERMYTQVYENAVRINNAVVFIDEGSGIDAEEFGGVPGECHTITMGSKSPEFKWPTAMPQHMMELPKNLLELAEKLRGMTPSRRGITVSGNVSAPMQDSAVLQSQSVTRLRSRFLASSFQRLAQIVFVHMAAFYKNKRTFPVFADQKYEPVEWDAVDPEVLDDYVIQIDENSIRPYSQTSLRAMVPVMKQLGIIDPETAMDYLDVPNKEAVLERLKAQADQAAKMEQQKAAQKAATKGKK